MTVGLYNTDRLRTTDILYISSLEYSVYVRVRRLYILPSLGEVLSELVERAKAQLPLQLGGVLLFGRQHLA